MAYRIDSYTMPRAMNAHGHPRIGPLMKLVAPHIAERYAICVAMPNPKDYLITSVDRMLEYHRQLTDLTEGKVRWLMKLYFTETLTPQEMEQACAFKDFAGLKYYPKGLTTNSDEGIRDPSLLWTPGTNPYEVLRVATTTSKPTSYHGADGFNSRGDELDPYEQERHFYQETFPRIIEAHKDGRHIGEHLTTSWGADFMQKNGSDTIGCTLTAHHLHLDRRDVYRKGFRSMYFCWPVVQPLEHKLAIGNLAVAGHSFVMLGDDGAGHPREAKECGCCAGGVYTAPVSLELYIEHFANKDALQQFEAFASLNGPRFYGIEPATDTVTLWRRPWHPRNMFQCDDGTEVLGYSQPDRTGEGTPPLEWQLGPSV